MKNELSARKIFIYCPVFIIIYNLVGNLSNDIYLPTLPALMTEFNVTNFLVQFSMSIWFIGVAVPQMFFGLIADRFGCRPLILWGGVVFLIGTFLCIIASDIYLLLVGRFFQGLGVASLNIATFATVRSHYYGQKNSIKFMSWINSTGALAPLIGPVLGSFLYLLCGWRSTFTFILFWGIVALIGLYFFMIETSELDKKLHFKINFFNLLHYYKPIYSNKNLLTHTFTYTCLLAALIAYLTSAPFVMHSHFQVPIQYFGVTQLLPFLTYIVGGITVTKLINTYNLKKIIFVGLAATFLSVGYFALLLFFSSWLNVYNYILAISIFLFGFGLAGSPLLNLALAGSKNKGGAAAVLGLSMAGMASLGSVTMAIFYKGDFSTVAIIISIFILLGIFNHCVAKGRSHVV